MPNIEALLPSKDKQKQKPLEPGREKQMSNILGLWHVSVMEYMHMYIWSLSPIHSHGIRNCSSMLGGNQMLTAESSVCALYFIIWIYMVNDRLDIAGYILLCSKYNFIFFKRYFQSTEYSCCYYMYMLTPGRFSSAQGGYS